MCPLPQCLLRFPQFNPSSHERLPWKEKMPRLVLPILVTASRPQKLKQSSIHRHDHFDRQGSMILALSQSSIQACITTESPDALSTSLLLRDTIFLSSQMAQQP